MAPAKAVLFHGVTPRGQSLPLHDLARATACTNSPHGVVSENLARVVACGAALIRPGVRLTKPVKTGEPDLDAGGRKSDSPSRATRGADVNQDLMAEAFRVATQMAADHGMQIEPDTLTRALIAVIGERDGEDEPREIAENALELLNKDTGSSSSRRGRRPF